MEKFVKRAGVLCGALFMVAALCGFSLMVPDDWVMRDEGFFIMVPSPDVDPQFAIDPAPLGDEVVTIVSLPALKPSDEGRRAIIVIAPEGAEHAPNHRNSVSIE